MPTPPHRRYKKPARTGPDTSGWTPEEREAHLTKKRLATPVAELTLSVRVINTLEEHDVILVSHLVVQTYESLMAMKNFGDKTLVEVRAAIKALGLPVPAWVKPPRPPKTRRPAKRGGITDSITWG